ncbi:hypothetical protein FA13DRAFT_1801038 [Coprinellus micaceus]|uniref:Uncharacterized protein n=1 Tax=Coprinellus micaceus TaxID=71717 RepID=A0A4Y7SEZ7_COPMI|nr:hypothetical protein FA13DRAFT_1801038 [Coprinellus micaceus]
MNSIWPPAGLSRQKVERPTSSTPPPSILAARRRGVGAWSSACVDFTRWR